MLLTHPFLLRCLPSFTTTPGPTPGEVKERGGGGVGESSGEEVSGDITSEEIALLGEGKEAERSAIGGRGDVHVGKTTVPVPVPAVPEAAEEAEADISSIPRIRLMSYSNKFDQFLISKRDVYCDNIIQKITDWYDMCTCCVYGCL